MPTFVFNWRSAMCVLGKGILCIVYWRRWLYGPVYRGEGVVGMVVPAFSNTPRDED